MHSRRLFFLLLIIGIAVVSRPQRTEAAAFTLTLVPGWNLISLPVVPYEPVVLNVFKPIEGKYDRIFTPGLGPGGASVWQGFATTAPAAAVDIIHFDVRFGIWIYMLEPAMLTIQGAEPPYPVVLPVAEGWNLIGYPSLRVNPVSVYLRSLGNAWDVLWRYDAGSSDPWKAALPGMQTGASPGLTPLPPPGQFNLMEPGKGYYLKAKQAGVIVFAPSNVQPLAFESREPR